MLVAADLALSEQSAPEYIVQEQEAVTHTLVVNNHGPSDINGAVLTVRLSENLLNPTWTCVTGGGATCGGSIADTLNLPLNGVVTYTIRGAVAPFATRLASFAEIDNPELEIDASDNRVIIDPVVVIHRVYLPMLVNNTILVKSITK